MFTEEAMERLGYPMGFIDSSVFDEGLVLYNSLIAFI